MPRTFTLAQIRDRVREAIDAEQMRGLSDPEVNKRISAAYAKYYAKLVSPGLGFPSETTQTITAGTGGTDTYALPADHFSTLRVDFLLSSGFWDPLDPIDIREIHLVQFSGASQAFFFRLAGPSIILYPTPQVGGVYRHIYAPAPVDLTTDAQTIDGVSGWEDVVVLEAAIRCAWKWEGDTSAIERERERIDALIAEQVDLRQAQGAKRMRQPRNLRHDLADGCESRDASDFWPYRH